MNNIEIVGLEITELQEREEFTSLFIEYITGSCGGGSVGVNPDCGCGAGAGEGCFDIDL
jgi:hypothetical protein